VTRIIVDKIDTNKDKVITKDELKAWITHAAKRSATDLVCMNIIAAL